MGDPQGPFAKLIEVLDNHGVIEGGRLASDVVLVSIGDHFDYDFHDWHTAGQEGLKFLRWLASHDDTQVKLLLGRSRNRSTATPHGTPSSSRRSPSCRPRGSPGATSRRSRSSSARW